MQQALVALGDKPASFVGSRDWIGSVEISLLLDHFYQVHAEPPTVRHVSRVLTWLHPLHGSSRLQASCRIIHLSSGSEFPSKASELARHFETHGTPVMIGTATPPREVDGSKSATPYGAACGNSCPFGVLRP